ncbi:MAG: hypothetical protein JWQ44_1806 [Chthoniobacter sp.]|nr:hypothetical protein [Chthoniobacter sp.]
MTRWMRWLIARLAAGLILAQLGMAHADLKESRAACRSASFNKTLNADPSSDGWRNCPAHLLVDTATGARPQQATTVRFGWTADEWRVLFVCTDSEPRATMTERDALLYEEEVVELFIDPTGDAESYFEIEVNPLNAVLDLVLRKNRSGYAKNVAWNCEGLRTHVRRTADGWAVELAIPFRSLIAEPPKAGAKWRVNFCRIDRPAGQPRELSAWSPTGVPLFHVPGRFGWIEFTK